MTLYSADVTKLAKPVKKMTAAHKKLAAKTTREPEPETEQVETVEKKKYQRKKVETPKKKVAAKKKKEETESEEEEPPKKKAKKVVAKKKKEESDSEEEPPKKKPKKQEPEPESEEEEPPKKKKRVRQVTPETTPEPIAAPEPVKKKRKAAPKKVVVEPPQWFQKYVEGVSKERAVQKEEKIPAKQVKQEAQEQAKNAWNDGLTRDRVTNEVDNHSIFLIYLVSRMYAQIFARK